MITEKQHVARRGVGWFLPSSLQLWLRRSGSGTVCPSAPGEQLLHSVSGRGGTTGSEQHNGRPAAAARERGPESYPGPRSQTKTPW